MPKSWLFVVVMALICRRSARKECCIFEPFFPHVLCSQANMALDVCDLVHRQHKAANFHSTISFPFPIKIDIIFTIFSAVEHFNWLWLLEMSFAFHLSRHLKTSARHKITIFEFRGKSKKQREKSTFFLQFYFSLSQVGTFLWNCMLLSHFQWSHLFWNDI